jgi:hypothetical protein
MMESKSLWDLKDEYGEERVRSPASEKLLLMETKFKAQTESADKSMKLYRINRRIHFVCLVCGLIVFGVARALIIVSEATL